MADNTEDGNTTRSRRVKGPKAWQSLIRKKRSRPVLSSDDEIPVSVIFQLAQNLITPWIRPPPNHSQKRKPQRDYLKMIIDLSVR